MFCEPLPAIVLPWSVSDISASKLSSFEFPANVYLYTFYRLPPWSTYMCFLQFKNDQILIIRLSTTLESHAAL